MPDVERATVLKLALEAILTGLGFEGPPDLHVDTWGDYAPIVYVIVTGEIEAQLLRPKIAEMTGRGLLTGNSWMLYDRDLDVILEKPRTAPQP